MSFLSKEMTFNFPFAKCDCFTAMRSAVKSLPKHNIKSENEISGTMQVDISPGMTSFTWGDSIVIQFVENEDKTTIEISSTAKNASPLGSAQQGKNIQKIMDAFSAEIKNYNSIEASPKPVTGSGVEDRLQQLENLRIKELITDAEYSEKRAKILSEL